MAKRDTTSNNPVTFFAAQAVKCDKEITAQKEFGFSYTLYALYQLKAQDMVEGIDWDTLHTLDGKNYSEASDTLLEAFGYGDEIRPDQSMRAWLKDSILILPALAKYERDIRTLTGNDTYSALMVYTKDMKRMKGVQADTIGVAFGFSNLHLKKDDQGNQTTELTQPAEQNLDTFCNNRGNPEGDEKIKAMSTHYVYVGVPGKRTHDTNYATRDGLMTATRCHLDLGTAKKGKKGKNNSQTLAALKQGAAIDLAKALGDKVTADPNSKPVKRAVVAAASAMLESMTETVLGEVTDFVNQWPANEVLPDDVLKSLTDLADAIDRRIEANATASKAKASATKVTATPPKALPVPASIAKTA